MKLSYNPLDETVTPMDNIEIFMHCSGGDMAVSKYYYDNIVSPMLAVHGIDTSKIVWHEVKMLSDAGSVP